MLGEGGTGPLPNIDCKTFNELCADDEECCSGICDHETLLCASSITECQPAGGSCDSPTDCCNLSCIDGECGVDACISDREVCADDEQCCSNSCDGGTCQPLNDSCLTSGNACDSNDQCCSSLCNEGVCQLASSFCIQPGDICTRSADCCSALCNIENGTVGTCSEPPSGSARCRGVEGTVCLDCNDCCSRLCVPYGSTGVSVCQPAQGCHILGDLCREDRDCCGGDPDSGLPGAGNVTCQKETSDATLGICRNPLSCSPQGNVCHYKPDEGDYPCSSSSAPNKCCGDLGGHDGMCQLDALGVPRCNGLGRCLECGEMCASSADCCEHAPCVPDESGTLRCCVEDVPDVCVPVDGPCTIDADCCPPYFCIRPVGSTVGYCGTPETPGTGGSAGQGGAGGAPPTCALYGQICEEDADCCYEVPCIDGLCRHPLG